MGSGEARRRGAGASAVLLRPIATLVVLLAVFAAAQAGAAEPDLPKLTGRVTDAAGLLSAEARGGIEARLKAHEDKTTDQVVVATVPTLQGLTVEDYANRLFRAWGLGDKAKNNGALLLVAPAERKVRIEVGYGLEGALTDALTKVIITTAIAPKFKTGDFAGGIGAGIDAMLAVLDRDADAWQRRAKVREDSADPGQVVIWLIVILVLVFVVWRMSGGSGRGRLGRGRLGRGGGFIVVPGAGGGWSGGFSDGGGFGGGFSGGGGSSGGGGASGDW